MKKILRIISVIGLVFLITGCDQKLESHDKTFYQTFDTSIKYLSYTKSVEDFNKEFEVVETEFARLHKLYDNFNTYEGVVNVKSLNNAAGEGPQKVEKDLFNIIKFSLDNYDKTNGKLNIAMGNVIKLWNDARINNVEDGVDIENTHTEIPDAEKIIPTDEQLEEARKHMNIKDIVLDEKNMTVELKDPEMLLDLGAIGKGYATELVAKKLIDMGVKHASINAGGNVRAIGLPGDGRPKWGIAVQHPELDNDDFLEVFFIGETSVVTSGDYQRYFEKDGVRYHHIIDPVTLKPAGDYSSVTIVTKDSGLADFLSTSIFLSSKEEAMEILGRYKDVNVLWYSKAEGLTSTDDLKQFMRSQGAKSGK